jgi:hypothetical protein
VSWYWRGWRGPEHKQHVRAPVADRWNEWARLTIISSYPRPPRGPATPLPDACRRARSSSSRPRASCCITRPSRNPSGASATSTTSSGTARPATAPQGSRSRFWCRDAWDLEDAAGSARPSRAKACLSEYPAGGDADLQALDRVAYDVCGPPPSRSWCTTCPCRTRLTRRRTRPARSSWAKCTRPRRPSLPARRVPTRPIPRRLEPRCPTGRSMRRCWQCRRVPAQPVLCRHGGRRAGQERPAHWQGVQGFRSRTRWWVRTSDAGADPPANFHLRPHWDPNSAPSAIFIPKRSQTHMLGSPHGLVRTHHDPVAHARHARRQANSVNVTSKPNDMHEGAVLSISSQRSTAPTR